MKNTHDPLDDELKNRLGNYSEEPDDALWSGIASNIQSVKPKPTWVKPALWVSSIALVAIVALVGLYQYNSVNDAGILSDNRSISNEDEKKEAMTSQMDSSLKRNATKVSPIQQKDNIENKTTVTAAEHKDAGDVGENRPSTRINSSDKSKSATRIGQLVKLKVVTAAGESDTDKKQNSITTDTQSLNGLTVSDNKISDHNNVLTATTPVQTESSDMSSENFSTEEIKTSDTTDAIQRKVADSNGLSSEAAPLQSNDSPSKVLAPIESKSEEEKFTVIDSNQPAAVQSESIKNSTEQKEKDKKYSEKKMNLYFIAMPTFGYQRIESNKSDNVLIESVSKVSNFSTKRLGIRAEIGVEYRLTSKIKMFGGLLYYQRKQSIDYVERTVINEVTETVADTVVVLDPKFSSISKTFDFEVKNIGIQLGVNYILRERKFLHTVGTGIEFHKSLNKLSNDQKNSGFGSNPSTYVFYNLYYRLQYPAQGKLKAVFQPTFNYSLYLNQDMNAPFYVKPYGLGLNLGVTYSF